MKRIKQSGREGEWESGRAGVGEWGVGEWESGGIGEEREESEIVRMSGSPFQRRGTGAGVSHFGSASARPGVSTSSRSLKAAGRFLAGRKNKAQGGACAALGLLTISAARPKKRAGPV
ncbi:MAG TPA: hypothetical protein VGL91_03565 [Acidobacteriota bacterium]